MSFQEEGFLAAEMAEWTDHGSPRMIRHVRLARDISAHIQNTIYSVQIPKADCHRRRSHRGPVVAAMFMRGIAAYQSTVLLCRRGLRADATTLCRALMEIAIKCHAILQEPEAIHRYVAEDEHYRKRIARNLLLLPTDSAHAPDSAALIARIQQLDAAIEETGHLGELSLADWARMARMDATYRSVYPYFSSFVHTGIRTLEDFIILDEDGEMSAMKFEPENTELILLTATEQALILCDAMDFEFGLGWASLLAPFKRRLVELHDDRERHPSTEARD